MTLPLLTHRPDFRLAHTTSCAICWAIATRKFWGLRRLTAMLIW